MRRGNGRGNASAEEKTRSSAEVVRQHFRTTGNEGLPLNRLGHLDFTREETLLDSSGNGFVPSELEFEQLGYQIPRDIVARRTKAARNKNQVGAREDLLKRTGN